MKKLHRDAKLPMRMHEGDSGYDLYSVEDVEIQPWECALVRTGLTLEIPQGYEAQVRPRSGLALNHKIALLNSPGTIDSSYRGEVCVIMMNLGKEKFLVRKGMRIAHLVFAKVENVEFEEDEHLSQTDRGEGGFGSSGVCD